MKLDLNYYLRKGKCYRQGNEKELVHLFMYYLAGGKEKEKRKVRGVERWREGEGKSGKGK